MTINWSMGNNRFSFGNLDAAQQTQMEDNPGLAFQMLMNWYGKGDPNFANTTLGRFIASQQDRLTKDYDIAAGQNQANIAQTTTDYNTKVAAAQAQLDALTKGGNQADPNWQNSYNLARTNLERLKATPPKPEDQLTLTKFIEGSSAGHGDLVNQFNMLSANQRGANPGNFMIRRSLW